MVQTERECGNSLGRFRTDNGGEFVKNSLKEWLAVKGTTQEWPPRSLQSNGVAERMNRTLQDKARSMMARSGLRGGSWGEVFATEGRWRISRRPRKSCGPVGCLPSLISAPSAAKSTARSTRGNGVGSSVKFGGRGVLIGYSEASPTYRVWDPVKGKVLNVGGVDFDEDVEPDWWKGLGEVGAVI